MAELGVASGVAGLLSLVLDVIQVTSKYVKAVSSSNRSVLDVLDTLTSLQAVFIRFQKHVDNVELRSALPTGLPTISSGSMLACEERLRDLKTLLEGYLDDKGRLKKRHALAWPLRSDQTKELLANLERHRNNFHAALSADNLDLSLSTHNKVSTLDMNERLRTIIDWLCPQTDLVVPTSDEEVDTLSTFCKDPTLLSWMDNPGNIIWCHGDTGCGKTVLMSLLYRDWNHVFMSKKFHTLVHFYDYQNPTQQSSDAVLRNLLAQILKLQGSVPPDVDSLYTESRSGHQGLSKNRLQNVLSTLLKSIPNVVILIDGFDECQFRIDNLSVLRSLAQDGASVLITSRKTPDIESLFTNDRQVNIRFVDTEIGNLVEGKLGQIQDDLEFDQAFKQDVINHVVSQCGGIFLLAKLKTDDLLRATSRKELRQALKTSPKTLSEMYQKTVDQMKRSRHAALALRVIGWITHAARPLRVQELRHGLAVEVGTSELDEDNLTSKKIILSSCLGLLTTDQDDFIRPIHASAFEFLQQYDSQHDKTVHSDLAGACVTCLSYTTFASGPCSTSQDLEARVAMHPIASYAAQSLGFHCQHVEVEYKQLLLDLLEDESKRDSATQLFFRQRLTDATLREEAFSMLPKGQNALQVACGLGLIQTSEHMVLSGYDVSTSDLQGWTPFTTAASYGHLRIMDMLIKAGANVNNQDLHGWTPLIWSVLKNNVEVAKKLLLAGALIDKADKNGWTAMHWAASIGDPKMIETLSPTWDQLFETHGSTRSIDLRVNGKARSKRSDQLLDPLLLAVDHQNILALNTMIDVHSRSFEPVPSNESGVAGMYRFLTKKELIRSRYKDDRPNLPSLVFPESFAVKLFDSAIRSNHLNMVKILVERGIKDVAYRELNGRNPLHTAAFCKTPEIFRFLLDQGFKLDTRDRKGFSPLDIAARSGTAEIIKDLITLPNFQAISNGGPTTPLHLIWSNDRLLKDHDSRIDGEFEERLAALDPEIRQQLLEAQIEIAKLMLESGVDVDRTDDSGQSPIFDALSCGVPAVKMLLTYKARTDIVDVRGNTLLHCVVMKLASNDKYPKLVETVLDCGVPVNAQNKDGCTALHLATKHSDPLTVQTLLNRGADPNIVDNDGNTALHLAAEHSDPLTVKTLVDRGADPNTVNKYKETPLHLIVARWTHNQETSKKKLEIFSLLLEKCEASTINAPSDKRPRDAEFFTFKYPGSWGEWDREYENAPCRSLLDLALLAGDEQVIEELKKRGASALSVKKKSQPSAKS